MAYCICPAREKPPPRSIFEFKKRESQPCRVFGNINRGKRKGKKTDWDDHILFTEEGLFFNGLQA